MHIDQFLAGTLILSLLHLVASVISLCLLIITKVINAVPFRAIDHVINDKDKTQGQQNLIGLAPPN